MNVFGIGLPEIAVIGALALIVFGPKRLPELGKSLGKTLKGFQAASNEFEKEIQKAMADPEPLDTFTSENSSSTQEENKSGNSDQLPKDSKN